MLQTKRSHDYQFSPTIQILFDVGCFIGFMAMRSRLIKSELFTKGTRLSSVLLRFEMNRFGNIRLKHSYIRMFLLYQSLSLTGSYALSTFGQLRWSPLINWTLFAACFFGKPKLVGLAAIAGSLLSFYKQSVQAYLGQFA